MARYYGDFRSIDTSNDPKGQRYRVLIFTNYTGANPYQYNRIDFLPDQYGYTQAPIVWPVVGTSLTMTENPFVVNYEGDPENIHKPYRCSTATASFLQSNVNLDFLNSNGTSTLVVLLKWKNEVSEVNGHLYNSETGETLNKKHVYRTSSMTHETTEYFYDYEPYRYDKFCYNVEWIGYSTPETFSMDYDHVSDTFTLNAQDALSVLQYKKYEWLGDAEADIVVSFQDVLLDFCNELGTYRKIRVTDTVKFPDSTGNVLTKVYGQQANNYDEDQKPTHKLEVLTQILTYLNLTAIPWRNELIITTPNAIAEGWNNYHTYELPNNGYIMNWPDDGDEYTHTGQTYMSDTHAVTAESYAEGGTAISTVNVYNSVKADIDEYDVDMLLPDIGDTKNLKDREYWLSTWSEGQQPDPTVNYYWEHETYNSNTPDLVLYQRDYSIAGSSHDTGWAIFDTVDLHRPNLSYYPTVYVIDDGGLHVGTATTCLQNPYNPTRKIFFMHGYRFSPSVSGADNDTFMTMMIARTKSVVMSAEQYLFIKGTWQFHMRPTVPSSYGVYANQQLANSSYCYVRAKISCCGKWLANDGTNTYGWRKYKWVDTEPTRGCLLYLEYTQDKKAFDTDFNFTKNTRDFDGIVVPLPVDNNNVKVGKIECQFGRPVGCGAALAWSATLRNFQFEIHSKAYYESRGTDSSADHNNNTEYKTEIDNTAIEDHAPVELKLSSDKDKGVRYSQTIRDADGYKIMSNVYNVATCNYHLPEQHITANVANQYATPTITLNMTLHNQTTPYTLFTWGQFTGKKFVVDSMQTDYELERQTVTIEEVKTATPRTTQRSDVTRNYRRNADLIFNDNTITEPHILTLQNDPPTGATFSTSNGCMMAVSDDVEIGCVTIQPDFDIGTMKLSVPNDIQDLTPTVTTNGVLVMNY